VTGPFFIDGNGAFEAVLVEACFTRQHQFSRMRRGSGGLAAPIGRYVIAGPEFG
jgi:hypothetical protein